MDVKKRLAKLSAKFMKAVDSWAMKREVCFFLLNTLFYF